MMKSNRGAVRCGNCRSLGKLKDLIPDYFDFPLRRFLFSSLSELTPLGEGGYSTVFTALYRGEKCVVKAMKTDQLLEHLGEDEQQQLQQQQQPPPPQQQQQPQQQQPQQLQPQPQQEQQQKQQHHHQQEERQQENGEEQQTPSDNNTDDLANSNINGGNNSDSNNGEGEKCDATTAITITITTNENNDSDGQQQQQSRQPQETVPEIGISQSPPPQQSPPQQQLSPLQQQQQQQQNPPAPPFPPEFQNEAWILCRLQHPNVVKIIGWCPSPPSLMLECMELGDLRGLIKREEREGRRLGFEMQMHIATQVALAMEYLHTQDPPILHLAVKLSDFGASQLLTISDTTTTTITGNCSWTAPEILLHQSASRKSDVYSFGIVLWEMAAGMLPFTEYSWNLTLEQAIVEGVRPPIPEGCPEGLGELMRRCWEGEEEKRPSFGEVLGLIEEIECDEWC